jgi:hypothetical protein
MSKGPRMLQTSGKEHMTIDLTGVIFSPIKEHGTNIK